MYYQELSSVFGNFTLVEKGQAIIRLSVSEQIDTSDYICEETPLLFKAKEQLFEYFAGNRKEFTLPINPKGTEFQRMVWRSLVAIPYGQTKSYQDIATWIGNPKACRAIGSANNKNPILLFIPCHRVIGSDGSLVGFGSGLPLKKELLTLEKSLP